MRKRNVNITDFVKKGKAVARLEDGVISYTSSRSMTSVGYNFNGDTYKRNALMISGRARLPFRIDIRAKLDFPAFLLLVGKGHIAFSLNTAHSIEDIASPSGKTWQGGREFDNSVPFNEFFDISVTYSKDEMQVLVNGEERLYSRRQAYMRVKNIDDAFPDGFEIGLAVSKRSKLCISTMSVTEFDEGEMCIPERLRYQLAIEKRPEDKHKVCFESALAVLPEEYISALTRADAFIKGLATLKFKRSISDRGDKLTYISSNFGVSYIIKPNSGVMTHEFSWFIVTNGTAETWYRKTDYFEETLSEIAKTDLELAERVFFALNDCVGCYGARCLAKRPYVFRGEKRISCHGCVRLHMSLNDISDACAFFACLDGLIARKLKDGSYVSEKIRLMSDRGGE